MEILLNGNDFARLSPHTRTEILTLLQPERNVVLGQGSEEALPTAQTGGISNLTPQQMRRFLAGVSENTENGLRLFIKNQGRVSIPQLEAIGLTSRAFAAALTRRVRTILEDHEAYFYDWDEDAREFLLSPTTLQSLIEVLPSE